MMGSNPFFIMKTYQELTDQLPEIEEKLGYVFKDKNLLLLSFVHRSFFNEHRDDVDGHNERLEFLGDSVLGLMVSDYLYIKFPSRPEGQLSHMRSYLVDATSCATLIQRVKIDECILLGRGESMNEGRGRDTILADLFEAVIGAIFLDGGLEEARKFFFTHFEVELDSLVHRPMRNWKAELQDYVQKKYQVTPTYQVMDEKGPDHKKNFHIGAFIGDELVGEGMGASKKEAETMAAKKAVERGCE